MSITIATPADCLRDKVAIRDDGPINNFETNSGSFRSEPQRGRMSGPRPELARRVLDIEDVLSWVYRDELPKARMGGGAAEASDVSPMFRMCAFGMRIDNWSREPGFPLALGEPHPDAMIVSAAVDRLESFADQAIADELDLGSDIAALAIEETQAVRRALAMMPAIVTRCAKLGKRPFWHSKTLPSAMYAPNGRPMVVRWETAFARTCEGEEVAHELLMPVEAQHKNVYQHGAYCPLKYDPDPQSIAEERAEYLVWWGALNWLALELAGKLATIAVIGPSAAQRPWNCEVDLGKPPRVFDDLRARTYRRQEKEAAAAHRMLGLRRSSGARSSPRQYAPRRLAPEKKACTAV